MNTLQNIFNLNDFVSPNNETSYYKGIPVQYRSKVRAILKSKGYTGYNIRFEYRGPRIGSNRGRINEQGSCRLDRAVCFSVYYRV